MIEPSKLFGGYAERKHVDGSRPINAPIDLRDVPAKLGYIGRNDKVKDRTVVTLKYFLTEALFKLVEWDGRLVPFSSHSQNLTGAG